MEELEAGERKLGRCRKHLFRRPEADQAGRLIVRIQPVAVRGVDDDAVAQVRQDRCEQLAGSRENRLRAVDGLAQFHTPDVLAERLQGTPGGGNRLEARSKS